MSEKMKKKYIGRKKKRECRRESFNNKYIRGSVRKWMGWEGHRRGGKQKPHRSFKRHKSSKKQKAN